MPEKQRFKVSGTASWHSGRSSGNLLWKSQSNKKRPSNFYFFLDFERWIQASCCADNDCDFHRIILMPLCFCPYVQAVTVLFWGLFSGRLSGQWIIPWTAMEDGARWLVYSCWLHRGGSYSDLWRQGNTTSSVQVRAQIVTACGRLKVKVLLLNLDFIK